MESSSKNISALKLRLEHCKNENNKLESRIKEMAESKQLSDHKEQIKSIAQLLHNNQSETEYLKNGIIDVSTHQNVMVKYLQNSELTGTLTQSKLEIVEGQISTFTRLSNKIKISEEKQNQLNKDKAELTGKLSEAIENNKILRDITDNHHFEIVNLKEIWEKKVSKLNSEIEDIKIENGNLIEKRKNFENENEEISKDLKILNDEICHFKNYNENKEIQILEFKDEIKNLEKERNLLTDEFKSCIDKTKILNYTQTKLETDLANEDEKYNNLKIENINLEKEIEILKKRFHNNLNAREHQVENQNTIFENMSTREQILMEEIKNLKSWLKENEKLNLDRFTFTSNETLSKQSNLVAGPSKYLTFPRKGTTFAAENFNKPKVSKFNSSTTSSTDKTPTCLTSTDEPESGTSDKISSIVEYET